jgi:hypothetical protein
MKALEDRFAAKVYENRLSHVYRDLLLKKPHLWEVFIQIIAKIAIVRKKPSFMGFSLCYTLLR